jgi:hypothetical protein
MQIKNNPRIQLCINSNETVCNGIYINHKGHEYSINKQFENEHKAMDYLFNLRDDEAEFSIVIKRSL